ncbi:glycosyltransferase [Pectinatus sottacetonis]|uniref:glycosyltransferase n=1 Tax=Pectinatus sottacetonis TaxID=1002795 RepID=UPI0018C6B938|nr:glycosyltransferase [Pectinatus sottacetonis]
MELVNKVKKPIITTFHTVLPNPNEKQQQILQFLCQKSQKVTTMAENSRILLQKIYNAPPEKIEKIHHGVPYFDFPDRETLKKTSHLEKKIIITTFGLLSPSKGIDYGIKAVGEAVRKHPDILYIILGQTHPVIRRKYGETYRHSLEQLVKDLHLEDNVLFVNKYLSKEEIAHWLKLSDIYMTPYLGQEQAVSGTLAYAAGYGRVIVSTPYPYAREMLSDKRGLLAQFKDSSSLAACINYLIENPEEKKNMEDNMSHLGKNMLWRCVVEHYSQLFSLVCHKDKDKEQIFNKYIKRLTDDTGIFQHAVNAVPDPSEGYTSDDNARGLIMAGMLFAATKNPQYLELAVIYLRFLLYAQNKQNEGWFRNFMDYDHHFAEAKGSEDCFGRCIWSLGFAVSLECFPDDIRLTADKMLQHSIKCYSHLNFLRACAYSLLGLTLWNNHKMSDIILHLAEKIYTAYQNHAEKNWQWFENELTYCNAVLPHALLQAYTFSKKTAYKQAGVDSLNFLLKKTFSKGIFMPIGCKGWMKKNEPAAVFDQQPVEACATILACITAYKLTNDHIYADYAASCFNWYTGKNTLGLSLIDTDTGGCMDGLMATGLNKNEGSESLISYVVAYAALQKIK